MRRELGRWLLLVAVPVLAASRAQAHTADRGQRSDDQPVCETVSHRSESEILGAQVAASASAPPDTALSVLPGETLCLRFERLGDRLAALRVVARADSPWHLLRIQHAVHHGHSWFSLISFTPDMRFEYRVGAPLARGSELLPLHTDSAAPGFARDTLLPDAFDSLIVFELRVLPSRLDAPSVKMKSLWLGVLLGAALYVNGQDRLNHELANNGYGPVSSLQPLGCFGFEAVFGRVQAGFLGCGIGNRSFARASDGRRFDLGQVVVGLEFGYVLYDNGALQLFPGLGIAAGDIHLDADPSAPPILPAQFGEVSTREQIRRNAYSMLLSFGAVYRWPVFGVHNGGLLLSGRAGYAQQLGQEDWVHEDDALPNLKGGPAVDVGGPFARLMFGIYGGL
jgi:hypothetical protein